MDMDLIVGFVLAFVSLAVLGLIFLALPPHEPYTSHGQVEVKTSVKPTTSTRPPRPAPQRRSIGGYEAGSKPISEAKPPPPSVSKPTPVEPTQPPSGPAGVSPRPCCCHGCHCR